MLNNLDRFKSIINIKFFYLSLVLYVIINIPLLGFLNGIFWDDWVLFNTNPETVIDRFKSAGTILGWTGYYHNFFMGILGEWSYKVLVFFIYPINGLLLSVIISKYIKDITANSFIFLTYLISPIFLSRYAAINSPYVFLVTFFLLGWIFLRTGKGWIAITFFLISFNMASLLVVYLFPVAEAILCKEKKLECILKRKAFYLILIFLPIGYFAIKVLFFSPYGIFKHYNSIDLNRILSFFDFINRTIDVTAITLSKFYQSLTVLECLLIATLVCLLNLAFSRIKREIIYSDHKRAGWFVYVFLILAIALSLIPYFLVNNNINFYYGFESRNMAVALFPLSILLGLFLFCLFSAGGLFQFACAIVMTVFLCFSFSVTNAYRIDWIKSNAIIESIIKSKDSLSSSFLIVVNDQTSVDHAEQRKLSYYEYSGIFKYSLNRTGLHVTNEEWWHNNFCYKKAFTPHLTSSKFNNTEDFEFRKNNFVTRVRLIDLEKATMPVFRLIKYKAQLELDLNMDWCSSVCKSCGL